MTYLDRLFRMTDVELADELDALFSRVSSNPRGEISLINIRNTVPEVVRRLRNHAKEAEDMVEIPFIDPADWPKLIR